MCAGRCREPRCIRSPCRGSQRLRRALGGTRILLAAAPTAPPCFCRWQRSSLLHRGFFPRRTIRRVDAVRIHPCSPFSRQIKQKLQYPVRILESLVGAGGFEPPKLKAADLQSVPIGHSGTRPYSVVVHPCAGRLVYFSMRKGFCQPPFFTFFQQAHSPLPAALHPVELRPVLC